MGDWNYGGQAQAGRMQDTIPGVQDAVLASWVWKDSSRGMGRHRVARRGGIDEILLGRAGRWWLTCFSGSLPGL